MNAPEISLKIKEIVSNVSGISSEAIESQSSFVEDLDLDSLSLLEIGVDVDYAFKLGVSEERLQELRTVQDTVDLVLECMVAAEQSEKLATA